MTAKPGQDADYVRPKLTFRRNRHGFLLGVTWVHEAGWEPRLTHVYLGWWLLTIATHSRSSDAR